MCPRSFKESVIKFSTRGPNIGRGGPEVLVLPEINAIWRAWLLPLEENEEQYIIMYSITRFLCCREAILGDDVLNANIISMNVKMT